MHSCPLPVLHAWQVRPQALQAWDTESWQSSHRSSCCPHSTRARESSAWFLLLPVCSHVLREGILVIWLNLGDTNSHKQLWVIFRAWKSTLLVQDAVIFRKKRAEFESYLLWQYRVKLLLQKPWWKPAYFKGRTGELRSLQWKKKVAFTGPMNLISCVNDWRVKRIEEQYGDLTLHQEQTSDIF